MYRFTFLPNGLAPVTRMTRPTSTCAQVSVGDQYPQRPRTGRAVRGDGFVKRPNQRQLEELAAKVLGPATTLHVLNENNELDDNGQSMGGLKGLGKWCGY